MKDRFVTGYKEASLFTGISYGRLKRMVERKAIRVIKTSIHCVMFDKQHLIQDIEEMEQKKGDLKYHDPGNARPVRKDMDDPDRLTATPGRVESERHTRVNR